MAEEKALVTELWEAIRRARESGELTPLLERIDSHRARGELGNSESLHLLRMGLGAFKDQTLDAPDEAEGVILQRLVPLALESADADDGDATMELHNLRELLADWINQYPDGEREPIRDRVLSVVARALEGNQLQKGCWTIAGIGYRSPVIVKKLWSIAESEAEHRGTALSTIVALGVPPEDRKRVLRLIEASFPELPPRSLHYALQELAAPETIDSVLRMIEKAGSEPDKRSTDVLMAPLLLGRIADRAWRDEELQDRLWDRVTEGCTQGTFELGARFDIRFDLAGQCNTSRVVPYFLRCLVEDLSEPDEEERRGWLVMDRLKNCVRPAHVEGWRDLDSEDASVAALRTLACMDSGLKGGFVTLKSRSKEDAWNCLLCVGTQEAVDWIEGAVTGEKSAYVQGDVLNTAACLAVPVLPPSVVRLIEEEYEFRSDGGSDELAVRQGATRLARSAATRQALQVLLRFGLTHEGAVLESSARAIGEVSCALVRAGDRDVVEVLFSRALGAPLRRHREGAISGLHSLAITGELDENAADPLLRLASDNSLPPYARGQCLEAIGFLPPGALREEPPAFVLDLAHESSGDTNELMWRAIELLVRQGFLGARVNHDLLVQPLGLKRFDDRWSLADVGSTTTWQAFAIALLSNREPDAFAPAAADVLRSADLFSVHPFLSAVVGHHRRMGEGHKVPADTLDALVERIESRTTKGVVETDLFAALRHLDSTRLVSEPWDRRWENWHPEAIVTLADELGEARLDTPGALRAIALLTALLGEGTYPIRRAACRAMCKISPDALNSHCSKWAESDSTDKRCRAAEAAGWSSLEGDERKGTSAIARLRVDPEPSVREAAVRALKEQRDREWATSYLEKVLAVRGPANEGVLEAYPYGQSLVQVADDESERRLRDHLASLSLAPNVRHWLIRLVDQIQKRWRKVTKEWPQPWLGWGGVVEELDGELVTDESESLKVHFSLWRKMRTEPTGFTEWGGAVRSATEGLPWRLGKSMRVRLRIEGRREAMALLGELTFKSSDPGRSVALLHGTGPYPTQSSTLDH